MSKISSLKTSNIKQCNDDNDCSKFNKLKIKYHCDTVRKICTKQKNSISFSKNKKVHIINTLFIDEFLKNITVYDINSKYFLSNFNKYLVKLKEDEKDQNIILKLKKLIKELPEKIEDYKNKIDEIDYFFKSIKKLPTGSSTGLPTGSPDEKHIIIENIRKILIYRHKILLGYNEESKKYFKK